MSLCNILLAHRYAILLCSQDDNLVGKITNILCDNRLQNCHLMLLTFAAFKDEIFPRTQMF